MKKIRYSKKGMHEEVNGKIYKNILSNKKHFSFSHDNSNHTATPCRTNSHKIYKQPQHPYDMLGFHMV